MTTTQLPTPAQKGDYRLRNPTPQERQNELARIADEYYNSRDARMAQRAADRAMSPEERNQVSQARKDEHERNLTSLAKQRFGNNWENMVWRDSMGNLKVPSATQYDGRSVDFNTLASRAARGDLEARAKLQERAMAGDPQSQSTIDFLRDNRNANSEGLSSAAQRTAESEAYRKSSSDRNAAARDAEKAKAAMPYLQASGGGKGGGKSKSKEKENQPQARNQGGGGGRSSAPRQQPMTAKERNDAAAAKANRDARRADSRGYSDSAYRDINKTSASWGETEGQRRDRLEKAGFNPNYDGWKDDARSVRDVEKAGKMAQHNKWGQWNEVPKLGSQNAGPSSSDPDAWQRNVPQNDGFNPTPQLNPASDLPKNSGSVVGFFKRGGKTIPITA